MHLERDFEEMDFVSRRAVFRAKNSLQQSSCLQIYPGVAEIGIASLRVARPYHVLCLAL